MKEEVINFTDFLDLLSEILIDGPASLSEMIKEVNYKISEKSTLNYYFWILKILKENHFVWFPDNEELTETTLIHPGYKLLGSDSYIDFRDYAYKILMSYK